MAVELRKERLSKNSSRFEGEAIRRSEVFARLQRGAAFAGKEVACRVFL